MVLIQPGVDRPAMIIVASTNVITETGLEELTRPLPTLIRRRSTALPLRSRWGLLERAGPEGETGRPISRRVRGRPRGPAWG